GRPDQPAAHWCCDGRGGRSGVGLDPGGLLQRGDACGLAGNTPGRLIRLSAMSDSLLKPLLAGDRSALARAITLIESTRADHRERADELLAAVLPHTGKSVRLGITGVPGVGKSTLIERFGLALIGKGRSLAVLAIDPSSKRGGGSILGDKTRMEE